jgi:hypothetical protein
LPLVSPTSTVWRRARLHRTDEVQGINQLWF